MAVFPIRRYVKLDFAVTCIPVAVTVVFMENHANVDVPRSTAEMRSMQSAGIEEEFHKEIAGTEILLYEE